MKKMCLVDRATKNKKIGVHEEYREQGRRYLEQGKKMPNECLGMGCMKDAFNNNFSLDIQLRAPLRVSILS